MVQGIQRQTGRRLLVGGLWLAVVVFAVGLRKEIFVGLWVWWVSIEESVGMLGMVSLPWV